MYAVKIQGNGPVVERFHMIHKALGYSPSINKQSDSLYFLFLWVWVCMCMHARVDMCVKAQMWWSENHFGIKFSPPTINHLLGSDSDSQASMASVFTRWVMLLALQKLILKHKQKR